MQENLKIKRSVFTAACLALAVVLRLFLGRIPNVDAVFCPQHLPVLLCGYACGSSFGLLCGFLAPLLGWLVCSLPTPALLPAVTVECCVCGFLMGFLPGRVKVRGNGAGLFAALLCAMLAGRFAGGAALGILYTRGLSAIAITMGMWLVSGLPGLVLLLVLLPSVTTALKNEGLVPLENGENNSRIQSADAGHNLACSGSIGSAEEISKDET